MGAAPVIVGGPDGDERHSGWLIAVVDIVACVLAWIVLAAVALIAWEIVT